MSDDAAAGDRARLTHMLDAIKAARRFAGSDRKEFEASDIRQYAAERAIQVIGDAAKAVSGETKYRWDDVAWRELAAMRDVLVHRYFGVDLTIVWEVVTERLPNVESRIEEILDVMDQEL